MLGYWVSYIDGYVDYARVNGGRFYSSHPEIYTVLTANFTEEKAGSILWAINKQALSIPAGNKIPFVYTLNKAPSVDKDVIEDMWELGKELKNNGASNDVIENALDTIIKSEYDGKIPGRMNELKLLFFKGYENIVFDSGDNIFRITP